MKGREICEQLLSSKSYQPQYLREFDYGNDWFSIKICYLFGSHILAGPNETNLFSLSGVGHLLLKLNTQRVV